MLQVTLLLGARTLVEASVLAAAWKSVCEDAALKQVLPVLLPDLAIAASSILLLRLRVGSPAVSLVCALAVLAVCKGSALL